MSDEKKDYKDTLNLPETDFPMKASLPENEPKILEKVFENGLYEKILNKNKDNKPFVLHDGPPYANGEIHIGHALNKVLKDAIVRYKSMQGFYSPFIPGYDTHGMPTEKKAIEKLGLDREKMSVSAFRDTCKSFNEKYIEVQTNGFKRLGVLGDWDHPYITYQPQMEAKQIEVFANMYKKGYIYKGLKSVHWCTDCETALAEAEIEYKEHNTTSIYVKFPVKDSKGLFDTNNTYVVIWTTTPWTLPGNVAITIGPDFEYSLVKAGEEKYILAKELVNKVMEIAKITDFEVIKNFSAQELEHVICAHPFLDRDSIVVLGSEDTINVDLTSGTGAVHTAPGYGKEDYLCGIKNNLEIVVTVDGKGMQGEGAGPFNGQYYAKSNKSIIEYLENKGLLLQKQDMLHQYPHCWRCKNPIIFRATNQWFASVDGFRKETLEAIKNVKWYPAWGEERITKMVEERNDWCISRQRTWGVPIPIFYCEDCEKEYVTEESLNKVIEIVKEKGTNAWFDMTAEELLPENAKCSCGCTHFKKETDIMDVWFDSGSTHSSVLEERGLPPADLYLEGSDQYRGWFQSSILTSVAAKGVAPYKQVVTHGYTVDEQGRKMSKSLGNGVDPWKVINESGADILRLWVLSSDYTSDVSISQNILKQVSEVYRKIRNTARFILGNTSDFDPNNKVKYEDLGSLDKWALTRLNNLISECTDSFEKYEFNRAYQTINQFCVVEMSNFYLDIIKDRLYTSKKDSLERRACQTVMYEILHNLVRILAPMICFTAEEIWEYMKHVDGENTESVMLSDYPKVNEKYDNKEIEEKWNKIIKIKEEVSKKLEEARAQKIIGHSLNAKVTLHASGSVYNFIKENEAELVDVFIVSALEVVEDASVSEDAKELVKVEVSIAKGAKCSRCWKVSESVKEDELCDRCRENLK